MALDRHTTSKIQKTEDLQRLKTYGFRGEALSSIASVSDFTMISGLKGDRSPYRLRQVFGKPQHKESVEGASGTTIIVRSLFENVPARFKFLKSEGAEHSAIKNTLKALALSQPQICFRILHKNRLLFYWPAPHKEFTGKSLSNPYDKGFVLGGKHQRGLHDFSRCRGT